METGKGIKAERREKGQHTWGACHEKAGADTKSYHNIKSYQLDSVDIAVNNGGKHLYCQPMAGSSAA
jgi:hypothetical protein